MTLMEKFLKMSADPDRLALEIKGLSPLELQALKERLADCGFWLIPCPSKALAAANLEHMIEKLKEG